MQIKEIPVGDTVGYGRHGVAKDRPVRTATVPIGYADGLNRRLSCGRWSFIVNGRKAPIFGNICMDTCMIDITGIDAREGVGQRFSATEPLSSKWPKRWGRYPMKS